MKQLILSFVLLLVATLAAPAAAQVTGDGPYQSPMRDQCTAELEKDAGWRAELVQDLRAVVHEQDAALMLRNKQHVVAAYAVIWGLAVVFVVFVWLRQRKLAAEIERLERELEKAVKS